MQKPMPDIVALFACIEPYVTATTLRRFSCIISAVLAMTGRVTMLGISRWAGQGGSYRTVQRFFSTVLPWAMLFWVFFRAHLHRPDDVYILAGDEVVVSKAGHHTHGLEVGHDRSRQAASEDGTACAASTGTAQRVDSQ
jgi:putative transposase